MTLSCQVEPLRLCMEEARQNGLLEKHYRELSAHQHHGVSLDPDFGGYYQREALGQYVVLALRSRGLLVGYWAMSIAPGAHYLGCLTSIMDLFYVDPEFRGFGAMMLLGRSVEAECRRRGVRVWFAGEKLSLPCAPMFKRLEMEHSENVWARWL